MGCVSSFLLIYIWNCSRIKSKNKIDLFDSNNAYSEVIDYTFEVFVKFAIISILP